MVPVMSGCCLDCLALCGIPENCVEFLGKIDNSFLISNFRRVLNIVCILLGISPVSDCCLPTFRNPLSVPSSRAGCRV
jgi:hypothetical protein